MVNDEFVTNVLDEWLRNGTSFAIKRFGLDKERNSKDYTKINTDRR